MKPTKTNLFTKIRKYTHYLFLFSLPVTMSFTLGECEGIGAFFRLPCDPFSQHDFSDFAGGYGVTSNGEIWSVLACNSELEFEVPLNYSLNSIVSLVTSVVVGHSGTIVVGRGSDWELKGSPTNEHLWDVCRVSGGDIYYASGNNGTVIKSTDDGDSWFQLPSFTTEDLYEINCSSHSRIYVFGSNVTGFKSTDGGNSWDEMNLYGGENRFKQGGGPDIYTSFFFNADTGYAFGEFGSKFYTSDGGNVWLSGTVPDFERINTAYFISPDSGMVAGDNGKVRFTVTNTGTWVEDTSVSKLTTQNINQISIINNSIAVLVGDSGTVIFAAQDSSALTSVNSSPSITTEYILSQNYPNPFNPSTKIEYSIPEASFVHIKVFDILGNEVATLVNEEQLAGTYRADFIGTNLTSGIYFYRLHAGSFVETKKMIYLK